jgi:hypothetical protein
VGPRRRYRRDLPRRNARGRREPQAEASRQHRLLDPDDPFDRRHKAVIEALRAKFPAILGPRHDDICYATQNRQDAVRRLGQQCDLVLVVGSPNSSNSNRLRELAEKQGVPAHLIDGADDIDPSWLDGKTRIGVTAGASAPESLVQGVVSRLRESGALDVTELSGDVENVTFALPEELRVVLGGLSNNRFASRGVVVPNCGADQLFYCAQQAVVALGDLPERSWQPEQRSVHCCIHPKRVV